MSDRTGGGGAGSRPADRYGDRPGPGSRRLAVAGGALLAAAGTAFVVWAGLAQSYGAGPQSAVVGYSEPTDTSVLVRLEVRKDPDETAVCEVLARNANHLVVGSTEVRVGPAEQARVVVETTVPTTLRAVAAEAAECRAV